MVAHVILHAMLDILVIGYLLVMLTMAMELLVGIMSIHAQVNDSFILTRYNLDA